MENNTSVRTGLKKLFDFCLHPIGLNIERHFGDALEVQNLIKFSRDFNIDLLLDIGANRGQYADKIIKMGFKEKIISFEPLNSAHHALKKNATKYSNWDAFDRCAIGDFDGEIEINISKNEYSSSLLRVGNKHLAAAPNAAISHTEIVKISKLDTISDKIGGKNILLKIDTQGFEDRVLNGAVQNILPRVKLIQLELSLIPLYEGGLTIDKMLPLLASLGFIPLFYSQGFTNRTNQEIQQLDGVFLNEKITN